MARIKKFSPKENLTSFNTFIIDTGNNSDYFRITEFKDTFTGGKNGFLIEGSPFLKESTEIKIEILDVDGEPIYYEPGNGIPEYYEGISKLISVYVYNDTPIGTAKITVLGELKEYIDETGIVRQIPEDWRGIYNVKWEREFKVNKLLSNEDRVRFFRRPKVNIDEIVKPIFSGNPPTITQTGTVNGLPLVPTENTDLTNFTLPTSYRLKVASGNSWTGSMENQIINFDNLNYSPTVDEVLNENEIIVSPPFSEENIVKSFTNEDYSITFTHLEGFNDLATALTGSFAKIKITDIKTFVGDAARVKVFRRSQSNLTDFEFIQEIQLESNELLRDIETTAKSEENYGFFTEPILDTYWNTSTSELETTFNQDFLYNSVRLNGSSGQFFYTTRSFDIQEDVEYTLDLNARLSGSDTIDPNDFIRVFLSGSYNGNEKSQDITTINSSTFVLEKTNFNTNIIAEDFDSAALYFEPSGSDWYINNVSLKASQETSFSPDEITFIQQVPKTLEAETFDYRFEFYDINNNFIPVRVEKSKTFVGGNLNLFEKSIEVTPDNLYFSFDSASNPANPIPPTVINFDVQTNVITGSINYTSGAFDFSGNEISPTEYVGGQYPGLLSNIDVNGGREPFLTVQNFTGSRDDITVQFVRYTAEVEGVSDTFIITRVEDGKGGVNFEIVPFRGTIIKNKEDKSLEIQALRIDGINRINLKDGLERGFSDAKLHLLSSSLDGTETFVSLSQAITNPDFIQGISAGTTGSGEIDYNAEFSRDAIDNELTVFLMDGPTSQSILTSIILTDLKDGLNNGVVTSTAEQFNVKYVPREPIQFQPLNSLVTASFQRRGTTTNPLSASLKIIPSSSIEPKTEIPHFYMFYETGAFNDSIGLVTTDNLGNIINNGVPGETLDEISNNPIPFYQATETKQLNLEFTYTEPITSASVTANKTFFITPDGLPGRDSINIDIEPSPVQIGANHKGEVYDFTIINPTIEVTQGDLFLIHTGSGDPGTFTTSSVNGIIPTGISLSGSNGDAISSTSMSLFGFHDMTALSASVTYNFDIFPYFTSSLITQSRIQRFNKVIEGTSAIEVLLEPTTVNFNGDELGFVSQYNDADTEINVRQQEEYLTYDESNLGTPGTYTASLVATNITIGDISASNQYGEVTGDDTLHVKNFSNMSATTASVTYDLTVYPYSLKNGVAGIPTSIRKKQVFTRTSDGAKARKVNLIASANTVVYNGDGNQVAPEGNITLTATAINTTGSTFFEFLYDDNSILQASSTFNQASIGGGDLPSTGSQETFTVNLRDGNSTGTIVDSDAVTLTGIREGATVYSAQLSNPASSITVEVDGTTFFDNAGTLIRAFKGGQELQYVEDYDEEALDPITFLPIGTEGQFSASVHDISSYLTLGTLRDGKPIVSKSISDTEDELFGSASVLENWNTPESNTQGFIIYKIDFENGRATQFVQQSFSTVFEGATGPGLVVRGEWDEEVEYIFNLTQKRRDAVFRDISDTVHYWATTEELINKAEYTEESDGLGNDDGVYTGQPTIPPDNEIGYIDPTTGWQYLGEQDFFVAAKLAIFEESFVKNTINVGEPDTDYSTNPQIAIVGGTDEPFISIGQSIQGYGQKGAFIGVTKDGGPTGTAGTTGLLSLSGDPTEPSHNSLKWDGQTLLIRGAIRQTAAGSIEPQLRGNWGPDRRYNESDSVLHIGQSWSANTPHTSSESGDDGPPGTGINWDSASGTGKTVSLAASTFVIEFDQDGNNPSPSSINIFATSSNFIDPFFKFTGGGVDFFSDESTFTDGTDGDNDIVNSIDLSTATISDMPLQFRVGVADGGLSGEEQNEIVSDVINIFGVKPGADSTPMYFITSTAGGTQIKNGSGTITLQAQQSDSTGLSNLASPSAIKIYSGSNLITTISGVTGTDYNPTIDASAIFGTMYLTLKDGSNTYDTITLLDVTDGLGGGSFISPNLKITRGTDDQFTPGFLSATASFFDTSGTEYQKRVQITPSLVGSTDHMAVSTATGDSAITLTADDGDGGTITLDNTPVATKDVVLTAVFSDPATNQQNTINETFYIVSDGADGIDAITVILTNESHTLPAGSDGTVSSFVGSGTTIQVFEGTTPLTFTTDTPSNGDYEILINDTNITVGSISGDSTTTATIGDHSNMTQDAASIEYEIDGLRADGTEFNIFKTQSFTKAKAGVDGTDGQDGEAAGVVYAGEWEDGTISEPKAYLSGDLKYVVKYNTTYYTCEDTHRLVGTYSDNVVYNNDVAVDDIFNTRYISTQATTAVGDWNSSTGYSQYSVVNYQGTAYVNKSGFVTPGGAIPPGNAAWTNHSLTDTDLFTDLGSNGARPDVTPSGGYTLWNSFGAQFTSVATDILFAQDVYADKTINVGTDDGSPVISLNADADNSNENPFISIGQDPQGFTEDGIFLGFDGGNGVLSFVSASSFFIYESGSIRLSDAQLRGTGSIIEGPSINVGRNLEVTDRNLPNAFNFRVDSVGNLTAQSATISGSVSADDGKIGNWVIEPATDGGVLRDDDSEIIFEPNIPELQFFSESVKRLSVGPTPLTPIEAIQETFTWTSPEPNIEEATVPDSPESFLNINNSTNFYSELTTNETAIAVSEGGFEFSGLSWSQINVNKPSPAMVGPTNVTPSYSPEEVGQVHGVQAMIANFDTGGHNLPQRTDVRLFLEVVDATNGNIVIGSIQLGSTQAESDIPIEERYIAEEQFGGTLRWREKPLVPAETGFGGSIAAASGQTRNITISTSTSEAKLRYRLQVTLNSGVIQNVDGNTFFPPIDQDFYVQSGIEVGQGSSGNDIYAFGSTINGSGTGISISKSNNFVEIKPGGIQVVSSDNIFVKSKRKDSLVNADEDDATIFEVQGGISFFKASTDFAEALLVEGDINPSNGTHDIGNPGGKYWENGYFVHLNGGYFDTNIRNMVAGGHLTLNNTSTPTVGVTNAFNISGVTRTDAGIYTVSFDNTTPFTLENSYAFCQGFGRVGDNQNVGDNGFVPDVGVKVKASNVEINTKDNDSNQNDVDVKELYFALFSR